MANQIKNLDKKIITSAKVEFLRAGYYGASLRQIALGAETSTASIYSRYNNKEGLFWLSWLRSHQTRLNHVGSH